MLIEKKNFTHHNLINLLISFFPLSLILGNLAININVVLICLVGLIIYRFEVFKIKRKIYQYLIYIFFFYLILITLITNIPLMVNFVPKIYPEAQFSKDLYEEHIVKSLFFLRFLLLFLVINKLVEEDHFKHNLFIISCSFFAFIVAFDILLQVSSGKNLLGYSISHYRPSSFFGDETIAGGYLQKFSLFAIISIISLSEKIKKNIYSIFLFSFFFYNNNINRQ